MVEKLWFSQSIEGLFVRGIGEQMTPGLRAELLKLGFDLTRLQPGYPNEAVVKGIKLAGATLFPELSEPEALHQIGRLFMNGFADTFIGKALVQLMKVIGPKRSIQRMERNFRTGGNYVDAKVTSLGELKSQVWLSDVTGIPEFYTGIIQRGGEYAGAKDLKITFEPPTGAECTFIVTWTE